MSKLAVLLLTLFLGLATPATGTPLVVPPAPSGCGSADPPAPGTVSGSFLSSGVERHYRVHIPTAYDPDQPIPMLVAMHGRGSTAETMQRLSGLASLDAVVVFPQALLGSDGGTAWAGAPYSPVADDVAFVSELISRLTEELCVDTARVYAAGISNGGGLSAMLGCRLADRLAGYVTVAGAFYPEAGECHPSRPLPLLNFHGTADTVVPYEGDPAQGQPPVQRWLADRAALNRCQGRAPTETPMPGVEFERWTGCVAPVAHYRVLDGPHGWPQDIDTAGLIWSFLTASR